MKSERYTRVYRYKHPHPRSKLLRVEFVFRRKLARTVTSEILVQGEMGIAHHYGVLNAFKHPDWKITDTSERFVSYARPEREAGKTVYWLVASVAPAFKRLVKEGVIGDPLEFLNTYFMPED